MKALIYILLAGIGITGCRSASELTHKAIAKDAGKVREITRAVWPCITTDSTTVLEVYESGPDSSAIYRRIADSLAKVKRNYKDSISIRYKDSCRSVKDNYDNGFNLGYQVGKFEGLQDCTPDTIRIKTTIRIKDTTTDADNADCKTEVKTARKWSRTWGIVSGVLALIIGMLIYILIKKR